MYLGDVTQGTLVEAILGAVVREALNLRHVDLETCHLGGTPILGELERNGVHGIWRRRM